MPFKPGDRIYYIMYNGNRRYGTFCHYQRNNFDPLNSLRVWARWDHSNETGWMPDDRCFLASKPERVRKGYAKFANEKIPITTSTPTVNA